MAHDKSIDAELHAYLHGLSRAQLLDLLGALAAAQPGVAEYLRHHYRLNTGQHTELVHAARVEIKRLGKEADNFDGEFGDSADVMQLQDYLRALHDTGHADDVLDLGERLLKVAARRIEIEEYGESIPDIAACLKIVFAALPHTTLPVAEQMYWATRMTLNDSHGFCQYADVFWAGSFTADDWSQLADRLRQDMALYTTQPRTLYGNRDPCANPFDHDARDQLTDCLIAALRQAGREAEILPLCEQEAPLTGNYQRLINELLAVGQQSDAVRWIERGIAATEEHLPGSAAALRNQFLELCKAERNWPQVAALQAEMFFAQPTYPAYQALQTAAQQAGCGSVLRTAALAYLESGQRPATTANWPLPPPALPAPVLRHGHLRFPATDILIDIALAEGRPLDALHWYEQRPRTPFGGFYGIVDKGDAVAAAITASDPHKAIAIWQERAQAAIAQTKQRAYEESIDYLIKIRDLLHSIDRHADWQTLLAELRQQHARKRNFIQLLTALER